MVALARYVESSANVPSQLQDRTSSIEMLGALTPITMMFFIGSAVSLHESALNGGAPRYLAVGLMCLTVSVAPPFAARIVANRRARVASLHSNQND